MTPKVLVGCAMLSLVVTLFLQGCVDAFLLVEDRIRIFSVENGL